MVVNQTPYKVLSDDNFHYLDPEHRVFHGEFATAEEAIAACKMIVERSLTEQYKPGMTAGQLFDAYLLFGEDPFVVPDAGFSAWDHAEAFARELAA